MGDHADKLSRVPRLPHDVIRPDGRGDRDLTPNPTDNFSPAWQPLMGAAPPSPPLVPAVVTAPFFAYVAPESKRVPLHLQCRRSRSHCAGTLSLYDEPTPPEGTLVGQARFDLRPRSASKVMLRLTRPARRLRDAWSRLRAAAG